MERFARISAAWIVTCIVGGLAVFSTAIVMPGDLAWLRIVLLIAGSIAMIIGVAGIATEIVDYLRTPKATDSTSVATRPQSGANVSSTTTGPDSHAIAVGHNQGTINIGSSIDSDVAESARRRQLVEQMHWDYWREYILSHDGITPRQMAGSEPAPIESLNGQLAAIGEHWNAQDYYRRKAETDWRSQHLGPIRAYDEGNDILVVERTVRSEDGSERVIRAHGWMSALTNHYDLESELDKNGVETGQLVRVGGAQAQPRTMTADERLAYFERLLIEQNPPPATREPLDL
jgi:hypothetical protein